MCCSTRCRWWSWQTLSMKLTTRLIFARAGKSAAARSIWTFVFACSVSGANIYGCGCTAYELVKSATLMISVTAWYWLTDWPCTRSLKVGVRSGGVKVSEVSQKKGKRRESAVNKKKIKVGRAQVGCHKKKTSLGSHSGQKSLVIRLNTSSIPKTFLFGKQTNKTTSHLLVAC